MKIEAIQLESIGEIGVVEVRDNDGNTHTFEWLGEDLLIKGKPSKEVSDKIEAIRHLLILE